MQTHSKFGDILIYEDLRFVKIEFLQSRNGYKETTIKPLYFKIRGRHFLIFATTRQELYFVNYNKRDKNFEVMYTLRPLEMVQNINMA